MRIKREFDEKCRDLADYFMQEPKGKYTAEDRNELAALIQETIEEFTHKEEDEA